MWYFYWCCYFRGFRQAHRHIVMLYVEGGTERIILYHIHVLSYVHVLHFHNLIVRQILSARLVSHHYCICPNWWKGRWALLGRLLGPSLGCARISCLHLPCPTFGGMFGLRENKNKLRCYEEVARSRSEVKSAGKKNTGLSACRKME